MHEDACATVAAGGDVLCGKVRGSGSHTLLRSDAWGSAGHMCAHVHAWPILQVAVVPGTLA